jgi:hypothetical protein
LSFVCFGVFLIVGSCKLPPPPAALPWPQYTENGTVVSWDYVQQQNNIGGYAASTTILVTQKYNDETTKNGLRTDGEGGPPLCVVCSLTSLRKIKI